MNSIKVGLISLGCSKNLVDSETMLGTLAENNCIIVNKQSDADVLIINTCGFIESAKSEAIDQILDAIDLKTDGFIKGIVVCGCLSQRYRDMIAEQFPEVDAFLGTTSEKEIAKAVVSAYNNNYFEKFDEENDTPYFGKRVLSTPKYTAYLKIAEGCNNCCTYCAIPIIRGSFRSIPKEALIDQAKELAKGGVKELCIVAQDPTEYGSDLYGKRCLTELLEELCKIDGIQWIRLLYLYPHKIDENLLQFMSRNDKIVKYIDMPIQHCNSEVLKNMNRPDTRESLKALIGRIRELMPEITLRTTLIAGFPGETDTQFEELCNFTKEMRFERMGAFAYSEEEDTPAFGMEQVDNEVRQRRAEILLEIQSEISKSCLEEKTEKELTILTEGYDSEGECYIGRSYMDAPEVDGKVYFTAYRDIEEGEFVKVKITGCLDYDLTGELI